jgi:DNA-binding HxlR family transcriptional regulator
MIARDSAAISQLLSLLESRYAIRVLWALKDGHPQTFRLLQDSVGGITPNTLNTRIKELRQAGLMAHGHDGYVVTPSGADLLRRLADVPAFANRWAASQARKKLADHETGPVESRIHTAT